MGKIRSGRRKRGATLRLSDDEVERSFQFHENLNTALDADGVLSDTALLDQEHYVHPTAEVSEERAKKALMRFLNLKDGDTNGAIDYIVDFGEFDHLELTGDRLDYQGVPDEVQRFVQTCISPGRNQPRQEPFAFPLHEFWDVRSDVLGLWKLGSAISNRDINAVRNECQRMRPTAVFRGTPDWLAIGKEILCAQLSAGLNPKRRNRRLVLAYEEGRFVALTACLSVREALYVELLRMILSDTEYRRCQLCDGYFLVTVQGKRFCSLKCQNAAKVRSWRARQESAGQL